MKLRDCHDQYARHVAWNWPEWRQSWAITYPTTESPGEDSTMGSGLWFITILKEQPWIGLIVGIILFLLLFLAKKWLVAKLMGSEGES
ncbi:MAG: hypothetical protein JAY99_10855 [Candidatus Thiodiazotropha lotti]|uniref:hypothetical protein n=1 Tax=Candidatus Thiodiazotropha endoloripes TaxID=1818881 RepID=UPI001111AC9D|nr:hypothetical protein [Candidatus Thiodiazotropha endoloripes]MCG7898305.1 hypothetical protein [Candidatus Thiodiazotropha weberae]MCG7992576.1 hypothetical protein [Candidatus Thiodiazotropha lotti]MCG7900928.1 hypothetical protein [Candidatus Thiodiazotropha weberae]MCG7914213.1 hypothetical protein [Candidatus Thiodiazotropha weberae]MCG8000017.1 hypothetical protein [Candidatus Thiodiazotropha lotti]